MIEEVVEVDGVLFGVFLCGDLLVGGFVGGIDGEFFLE